MGEKTKRRMGALILGFWGLTAPGRAADPKPVPCAGLEHRQFDFWVGEWKVKGPKGNPAGESSITSILGKCVILENWRGAGGSNGTSLNTFDSSRGVWHQTWMDDSGGLLQLEGHATDGRMVLEGRQARPQGGPSLERITWERQSEDRVRQLWESSTDEGKTWKVLFDGLYLRAATKGD